MSQGDGYKDDLQSEMRGSSSDGNLEKILMKSVLDGSVSVWHVKCEDGVQESCNKES